MAQRGGERACVSTAAVNGITDARELASAVHEFGHLIGAKDHYGNGKPSTENVNDAIGENLFNRYCIYGEEHGNQNVLNNIQICEGCRMVLLGEIDFPDVTE